MEGIDKIKNALEWVFDTLAKVREAIKDGKLRFREALSLLGQLLQLFKIVKSGSKIKAEFLDLEKSEREELNRYFADRLELSNQKVELMLEKIFAGILLFSEVMEISKPIKGIDEQQPEPKGEDKEHETPIEKPEKVVIPKVNPKPKPVEPDLNREKGAPENPKSKQIISKKLKIKNRTT